MSPEKSHFLLKNFQDQFPDSISELEVGFMGGDMADPEYAEVKKGKTNHVEVAHGLLDTSKASFEDLVRFCHSIIDPTTHNQQGIDHGTQYATVIFVYTPEQAATVTTVIADVQALIDAGTITGYSTPNVATQIRLARPFYPAHEGHMRYFEKHPEDMGECSHRIFFKWSDINVAASG
ncbi:peptide methionine sulfoxide reductase msrA [Thecamonas trahens ATCC 50062]|uniref:peptide-methionine (S)-S-oxide reductase n=1 Tax=Thecamonas trahens ATCC 50062 TaxID=461836 RepID=A0A0L0D9F1_THETB|nr:peptide methionine sulfoxide reductase msrA [Thecamonas trahens ATCC 50062]KNC48969.1 peptide methionine sulfoxide reductase msrA [Thecamonas trahens ATCC 50062]|eukprot:XP_013758386.1 peptide methionine sulfoxide reductase msrA [Thecamonas trahens ATCC 50062]